MNFNINRQLFRNFTKSSQKGTSQILINYYVKYEDGSHEGDNFIGLLNYEDVKTLSILHITVLIAPYPHEKEQAKLS